MLHKIINALIVRYNVRKIAPKGELHSAIGEDGPSYGSAGLWQGFPCYRLNFLFNDHGMITHAGNYRCFPEEETSLRHHGSFLVAIDTSQFATEVRRRYRGELHNERICSIHSFIKNEAASARENIVATAEFWNRYYGFDPDHDGFTVGSALDGDAEEELHTNRQLY